MELRTRRLMFTLGGSILLSLGVLAACSSDSGFTQLPGGGTAVDSGKTVKATGSDDDDDQGDDQGAGTTDGGCSKLRTSARQYCFGARTDDAGSGCSAADAAAPQICCTDEKIGTTFTPAKCAPTTATADGYAEGKCGFSTAQPDAGGREFHCLESRHCPAAATQCCLIKGTGTGNPTAAADKNFPATCNQFFNSNSSFFVGGTRCREECDTGEVHLCGEDSDCDTGESCYVFTLGNAEKNQARFTGVCKPTIK